MIKIRKSKERGFAEHGWLKSYHTFSFANYFDPNHMGFRDLRVINEDRIQPGEGFGTHHHEDMEIISYVIEGALEHKDSMGNGSVINPGDVQYMSAGKGVNHSEFNHSKEDITHFLQIWILPNDKGLAPQYDQKRFLEKDKLGKLKLLCSPDGQDGSIFIRQDVNLYGSILPEKGQVDFDIKSNRYVWIQLIKGNLLVNDHILQEGDGVSFSEENKIQILAKEKSEFLLFDMC